jgi:leucyl/phenylalanyl-tRNA--protein transferase
MPVFQLEKEPIFPLPQLAEDSGLLAVGGDLSVERLIQAYAHGIFPWYSEGDPILWWSPDPRMILFPDRFKVSKSLRKVIEAGKFDVLFDTHFGEVIRACARVPRKGEKGTWITEAMINAYTDLHEAGYAHSVEIYADGELVGGLYGVSLGSAFFGESMFFRQRDASKIALYHLVERLKDWKFSFIDTQVETGHLKRLGAEKIPRAEFLVLLKEALNSKTITGKW